MSEDARIAMSTWLSALAEGGLVHGEVARAGLTIASYVVGAERLSVLRDWFHTQPRTAVIREKRAAIEVCIWMANADRTLDPEEAHFLKGVIGRAGLDDEVVDELVESIHDLPSLDGIEERLTHPTLRELMLALSWELAASDGNVDRLEEAFHVGLAKRLGVDGARAAELRAAMQERISLAP